MYCGKCGQEIATKDNYCQKCGEESNNKLQPITNDKPKHSKEKTSNNSQQKPTRVTSNRSKKIGILWLTIPIISLIIILSCYAITTFVIESLNAADLSAEHNQSLGGSLIKAILGFLGILSVIGFIAGIPIGIIYLNKKDAILKNYDNSSGQGTYSEIPEEIKGWSWGAAGLGWIWGLSHGVYISLLAFIPYVGLLWWIAMGIKGNEWAWRKQRWESISAFQKSQKKWGIWGIIFFFLPIIMILFILIAALIK
jgi:hypothetical protein